MSLALLCSRLLSRQSMSRREEGKKRGSEGAASHGLAWYAAHERVYFSYQIVHAEGGVSNVAIDGHNTLEIKALGVIISTFETLLLPR